MLLHENLQLIFEKLLPSDGRAVHEINELKYFRIRLQWESQTRFSDLAGSNPSLFGDMLITTTYVRIFVIASKTDKKRQGQWVTILASSNPASAYQSLLRVLRILQQRWDSLTLRVQKQVSMDIGADWLDSD